MNNMYLIPANSKKGQLMFNLLRPIDLAVFLIGVALTLIFFLFVRSDSLFATVIKILPICLGSFLVLPIPNYHNVLVFIREIYLFLANRRVYYWKGWCVNSEYSEK